MPNRKTRVFVIGARGFPGVQGGIEKFSEGFYPGLVSLGYEVCAFSIKRFAPHDQWKGVKFIRIPTPSSGFLEKPVYSFFATLYCVLKRPDIVHIHSIASGTFIFILKLFGLKVVARYNSRDYLHDKWGGVAKMIFKFSEKQFLLADYIVANNLENLSFLQSLGRKKNLSFLPNGIDIPLTEKFESGFESMFSGMLEKNKYILYVGRVTQEKNIGVMIEAFLRLGNSDIKLAIAGGPVHHDNYFKELKEIYPQENIVFLGNVQREKLGYLYANCCLYIIPSLHEAMPNALLESMSFNCLILASRIPAHQHFKFSEDSYFDPGNVDDLCSKMRSKLNAHENPDYSFLLKDHEWNSIIEKVHHIHLQLLDNV